MSRFAKVNLLEVEDSVGERVPGLEGRFSRKHLASRDLGISHFRYAANLRSPFAHSHREQEEAYVVVAGSGRVQNPAAAVSIDRNALPSASLKLRPSAIASPTDFIVVVSTGSAAGNFSNANRGIFTTT